MRNEWGDIDITEYLARLPDRGECLTHPHHGVSYVGIDGDKDDWSVFDRYSPYPFLSEQPHLVGTGPVECSTSTDVALLNDVIWDTNQYYRKLGFTFPYHPTKKELRVAFVEHGGPDDAWLMMVFKNLIDDKIRRLYDGTPLGQFFLDADWQQRLKQRALREALRRVQEYGEGLADFETEEVLKEWGLTVDPPQGDGYGEDSSTSEDAKPSETRRKIPWQYSYYLWRSTEYDTERLGRWQQLLVSAFAQKKVRRTFSVGYFGKQPHRCLVSVVDGRQVLFLNEDQWPDEELAAHMVMQVLLDEKRAQIGAQRDYPQLQSRW
jgi:hypothetical protein